MVVPSGYQEIASLRHHPYLIHIGPFYYRRDSESHPQCAFVVREDHCNFGGTAHGGMLFSFADFSACTAAMKMRDELVVTVSMTIDYVTPARVGELVETHMTLVRRTRRLAFVRGELRVGTRTVTVFQAVVSPLSRLRRGMEEAASAPSQA